MTIDSWRAAVSGSWSRVLLYPGALTALALALLLALFWRLAVAPREEETEPGLAVWWSLPALGAPLLALALLPLPAPAELRLRVDLTSLLLLLEVPTLIIVLDALRAPTLARQADGTVYLAGLLTAAPLLALVLGVLAAHEGTLVLNGPPAPSWQTLIVAVCWLLALPPLLHISPWSAAAPPRPSLHFALHLRRAGHLALATLPWLARWPEQLSERIFAPPIREKATFLVTFVSIALLLLVWDRSGRRGDMRRWGLIYLPIALALTGLLLYLSLTELQERLR